MKIGGKGGGYNLDQMQDYNNEAFNNTIWSRGTNAKPIRLFDYVYNNTLIENTVDSYENEAILVQENVWDNIVLRNNVFASGSGSYGVYVSNGLNNTVSYNNVTVTGDNGRSIYFYLYF